LPTVARMESKIPCREVWDMRAGLRSIVYVAKQRHSPDPAAAEGHRVGHGC
jgi:hypothetical protein